MAKKAPPPLLDISEDTIPKNVTDSIAMLLALSDDIVANIKSPEVLPEFIEDMVEILGTLIVTYHGVQYEFAERSRQLLTACRSLVTGLATDELADALRSGVRELPLCWETDLPQTPE